jgi:hypothetical protein
MAKHKNGGVKFETHGVRTNEDGSQEDCIATFLVNGAMVTAITCDTFAEVVEQRQDLKHEVVSVKWEFKEDWTGDQCILITVTLAKYAASTCNVEDVLRPIAARFYPDRFTYFNYQTEAETIKP